VAADGKEAVKWYKKAAGKGYIQAMRALGAAYESGSGVDVDKAEALKWYKKAAALGDSYAKEKVRDLGGD
jgi:TPR repeat protein